MAKLAEQISDSDFILLLEQIDLATIPVPYLKCYILFIFCVIYHCKPTLSYFYAVIYSCASVNNVNNFMFLFINYRKWEMEAGG